MKQCLWLLLLAVMWAPTSYAQTANRVPIQSVDIEEPELPVTPTFLEAVKDLPIEQVGKAVQFLDPERGELVPYIIPPKKEGNDEAIPTFTFKEIVIVPDDFGSSHEVAEENTSEETTNQAEATPDMLTADEASLFDIPDLGVSTVTTPETIGLPESLEPTNDNDLNITKPLLDAISEELGITPPAPEPAPSEPTIEKVAPAPAKPAPKVIRISIPKDLPTPKAKPKAPKGKVSTSKTVQLAKAPTTTPDILPWKKEDKTSATPSEKRVKVKAATKVLDAYFTSRMVGNQPADRRRTIRSTEKKVSFYSSVKANAGDVLRHQWLFEGNILFEKPFTLKQSDWQGWTTVALRPNFAGNLTARLVNDKSTVLTQQTITVVP